MAFVLIDAPQRSEAWHQARLGRLTGSCASDMLAQGRKAGEEAAARRDLRLQLVLERLTGVAQDDCFVTKEMQRGIDCEPLAFVAYEALTGRLVRRTGFLAHTEYLAGASLDGDLDQCTGIVELKCPKSATHLKYLRAGIVPPEHIPQLRHNVWIAGAEWADFCSFDDRLPPELQLFCVRVDRAALDIPGYEKLALAFLAEVDRELADVSTLRKKREAA